MQRNGNDGIGTLEYVSGRAPQEPGEWVAERHVSIVFQRGDDALELTFVRARTEHGERLMCPAGRHCHGSRHADRLTLDDLPTRTADRAKRRRVQHSITCQTPGRQDARNDHVGASAERRSPRAVGG